MRFYTTKKDMCGTSRCCYDRPSSIPQGNFLRLEAVSVTCIRIFKSRYMPKKAQLQQQQTPSPFRSISGTCLFYAQSRSQQSCSGAFCLGIYRRWYHAGNPEQIRRTRPHDCPRCAYHAWRFNSAGECLSIPQSNNGGRDEVQPAACARVHPTQVIPCIVLP